ncbi:L-type lectin-domain containing receptor kinase IX.1-like [Rosa rugosa]|uniref:L-type lectin-domain containing receptor kinase IX.1-like n=1 Tax=Rosa rugosa TaxID=74645 RepID=UPI002B404524|nr:L-type lectin-domain containing receptor kinase IX.1-like [Rosa rugosa]
MVVNHSGDMRSIWSGKLRFLLAPRLCLLIFLFCPSATPLSFTFPSFNQDDDIAKITREGAASVYTEFLYLTKYAADQQPGGTGRATYKQPFLLRENTTGKLADFTTNFTFSIYAKDDANLTWGAGDGLAFFLAPDGSELNSSDDDGFALGLPSNRRYPFVAVEFDIYKNYETIPNTTETVDDPSESGDHVGIDVNTVKSLTTTPWNGSIIDGQNNDVRISYNSSTKNLSVAFTTFVKNGAKEMSYINHTVDLKDVLPDRVIVGFSASTGNASAIFKIVSWNFTSTPLVDENARDNTPVSVPSAPAPSPMASSDPNSGNKGLVVGLGVGASIILVGGLALVCFIFWKKKETTDSDEDPIVGDATDDEFEQGTGPRKFLYGDLVRATGNFQEEEKLGQGGFGGVYKGFIKDLNSYVAVKRISKGSKQGVKEYATEVRIISRLRHRNLVQLIGWCHKKKELLLVYEFMPNGSLDSHLFKQRSLLTWEARYKIAQGLASGLLYLHEGWEQCVLHRDIKCSNIMLDSNFNAKLGDFGLARLVDHGKQSQTTVLAGTMGYMAPECATTGKASKETDVYSFGIVALEIACGRKPIDVNMERDQINIVEWVWKLYGEGRVIETADPKLCGDFDEKQVECLIIVGLWCAHPDYVMRPSIQQAIQVLNFEVPVPILPSKFPVATYSAFAVSFSKFSDNNTGSSRGQSEPSTNGYSSQFTTSSTTDS